MTPSTEASTIGNQPRKMNLGAQFVRGYCWLANREIFACTVILALTLGLRAALLPWLSVPQPTVHDEFSYLLAADTYAHGRLTNPPHPFWQHFETFHELMQPTYASKYQPLQGLVLAFGQKFFGQPWIGVYLSAGFMCAAICWMLQGWISPGWALLGALLFALRVGVLSYWMNSYMGGAVPAIGGALALGALARICWRRQFGHSFTWALGLVTVVLSRPYDAAVLGCSTLAILVWFLRNLQTPLPTVRLQIARPALIVFAICAAAVAYNNYRVTGHALTLPYQAHDRQYAVASNFTMIPLRPVPQYHHAVMRQFWADWHVAEWRGARTHALPLLLVELYVLETFFFPYWTLFIPILLWPYALVTAEERVTVFVLLVFLLSIIPLIATQPHYAAAFAGIFYLRFLHTLKRLWSWRPWGKPTGQLLGSFLVAVLLSNGFRFMAGRDIISQGFAQRDSAFGSVRHSIIEVLEKQPGRQLVLLRYRSDHNPHEEWVYNNADIDASQIVWAREMSPGQDRPFLEYFHDRKAWMLEPDQSPPKLSPYPHEAFR